jgi:hypothetical protein
MRKEIVEAYIEACVLVEVGDENYLNRGVQSSNIGSIEYETPVLTITPLYSITAPEFVLFYLYISYCISYVMRATCAIYIVFHDSTTLLVSLLVVYNPFSPFLSYLFVYLKRKINHNFH